MATFDLEQFQTNITSAIVDGGHSMDMLLVLSQLIGNEDMKALFAGSGVDVTKLQRMLKTELNQRLEEKERRDEHVAEHRDSENFEYNKYKSGQDHNMKERVHALVNAVELRKVAEGKTEVTAVDVFREALSTTLIESAPNVNPVRAAMGSLTGVGDLEYAGVKTFEILEIKPFKLFPALEEKIKATTKTRMNEVGESTGEFLAAILSGLEKQKPGAAAAIASALAAGKKEHPRIN